ncbi:hypothetical protein [Streptomyces sp. NPDC056337]|uniref:hypothetical protein n=1 Tax=Streptomyces sp. NPDC056337 TaxID=3345787 RepID=UPI0035E2ECB6
MTSAERTVAACKAGAFLSAVVSGYSATHHPLLILPGLIAAGFLLWGAASARGAASRQRVRRERTAAAAAVDARLLDPEHLGNKANAEDCLACCEAPIPPPYPFICPGPTEASDQHDQPSAP